MNAKRAFGWVVVALLIALLGATAAQAAGWGDSFPIGPETGFIRSAATAMDAGGKMVVAWTEDVSDPVGDNYTDLYAQRLDAAGAPMGDPLRLNANTDNREELGGLSMDAAGNFVAVWSTYYGLTIDARCFAADGAPRTGEFAVTGGPARQSDAAMADDGRFVIAWVEEQNDPGGDNQVYARRFAADCQPMDAPFLVNNVNSGDEYDPAVAMDAAGNFIVAWTSQDGIAARRFTQDGAPRGGQFRVNQRQRAGVYNVDVATDAAGNAVFAWTAYVFIPRWGHEDVYVRRFNARSVALGGEFLAHDASAGDEASPRITARASGEFAITYLGQGELAGPHVTWVRFYNAQGRPTGSPWPLSPFGTGGNILPSLTTRGENPYLGVWAAFDTYAYNTQLYGRLLDGVSGPTSTTFLPTNDAYVSSAAPEAVFNSSRLNVRNAKQDFNAYLKFNVAGLTGTVQAARLRLWVVNAASYGGIVYATAPYYTGTTTLWQETGLTWNNAPLPYNDLGIVAPQSAGRWVEVDVTPAVLAALADNGRVSLAIGNGARDVVAYSSKEGAHAPELVIFTGE